LKYFQKVLNENVSQRRSFTLPRNTPAYYEEVSSNEPAYRYEDIPQKKSNSLPRNLNLMFNESDVQDYFQSEFLTEDYYFTSDYAKQYESQTYRRPADQSYDSDLRQTDGRHFEAENYDSIGETVQAVGNEAETDFSRQTEEETTYRNFSDLDLDLRTLRGITGIRRSGKFSCFVICYLKNSLRIL
jgi:hypothetical protein